jgi:hypothetical protein
MDDTTADGLSATRRRLLRRGLTLAVAAPALVSALRAGTVWANDDDDDDDDDDEHRRRSLGQDIRDRIRRAFDDDDDDDTRLARIGVHLHHFSAGLCRVSDASGFSASSPGTDSLTSGRLRLVGRRNVADDDKIAVVLRGAPNGVSYEVMFLPASGGRESLGNIGPTNSRGSLVALTPKALDGARRVGSFVLVRRGGNEDGRDEFVSCLGD